MTEDALRQAAAHKDRLLEGGLVQYIVLCDRLQIENIRIPYSFAMRLHAELVCIPLIEACTKGLADIPQTDYAYRHLQGTCR